MSVADPFETYRKSLSQLAALEITLIDRQVIVIDGYGAIDGGPENQLFLSAGGFLTEVNLTQGAGADDIASYVLDSSSG